LSKRLLAIIAGLLLIGVTLTAAPVYAQAEEPVAIGEVTDPGTLPDSPFYFMKTWNRAFSSFFAFNNQEKAELALRFANEDALAIHALCENGQYELAEQHCQRFQEQFQRAIRWMEKAREGDEDVEGLVEKLKNNQLRQRQVLAGLVETVPVQAQEGLLNAMVNSSYGLQNAVGKVQGQQQMEQFREELNLQMSNMGQETQLQIQERLEAKHQGTIEAADTGSAQPGQGQQNAGGNK
jgi:hypothetical protein